MIGSRSLSVPGRMQQGLPLAMLVALCLAIGIAQPDFLSPATLMQTVSDTAVLFLLAAAGSAVIMLGGIDLSVQAMASLAGIIVALTIGDLGYGAFPLALAAGALAGLCSGLAHVKLKVPSFIATLAVGGILKGIALILSKERSIFLPDDRLGHIAWITGTLGGIPNVVIVCAVVACVLYVVQTRTVFGRYTLAIGAGEAAAYASGVRVDRQKLLAFVLSGAVAALAGVVLGGRLASGSPVLANQLLLPSIAAVVVGGTAITGGVGSVARTVVGALLVSVIRIGMTFVGVNIFAQQIVFGVLLILAVAVTIDRNKLPIVK